MAQAQFQIPQALVALGYKLVAASKAIFQKNIAGVEIESEAIAEASFSKQVKAGLAVLGKGMLQASSMVKAGAWLVHLGLQREKRLPFSARKATACPGWQLQTQDKA
jgi:hypothetical protein